VPALVKVKLKLLPGGTGELKAPWFAVTVWVTLSWFVQVTLVPTLTVRLFGLNEKFIIETLFPLLLVAVVGVLVGAVVGVFVGAVVGVFVGAVVVVPPQAARSTRRPTASRHRQAFVVVGVDIFCISLPLLQCYCMNTAEDLLSPSRITLPGYITQHLRLMTDRFCEDGPHFGDKKRFACASGFGQAFSRFSTS
jgi:hypothetical protein